IQAGALSGGLVCVDIDAPDVLDLADQYLPPTGMVEGRPGKPRSHRWYTATNVPAEVTAGGHVAGGLGRPRTVRFKRPDGTPLIDFLGTGAQAVAPPSVWTSKKGGRRERRAWDVFGEPAALECQDLFEAVCRLAASCGWAPKERKRRSGRLKG